MSTPIHDAERERLKMKNWQQSFSGGQFTALDLKPEQVDITDIAHALSRKCRYTGHALPEAYSVAEHSWRVSWAVPPAYALPALLHDASEAYLPDLGAPVKGSFYVYDPVGRGFTPFRQVEYWVLSTIFAALDLSPLEAAASSEVVKKADLQLLATECRDLLAPPPEDWGHTEAPLPERILPMSADVAKAMFLGRYYALTGRKP